MDGGIYPRFPVKVLCGKISIRLSERGAFNLRVLTAKVCSLKLRTNEYRTRLAEIPENRHQRVCF